VAIFSWKNMLVRTNGRCIQENNFQVHGEPIEVKIKIPSKAKQHLVEYTTLELEEIENKQ